MYNSIYDSLNIGKKVIYLPSCHSTNDIAAELVHKGPVEEGTIVITDNQVGGRGQRGSKWYTEPSLNLTFSIILRPKFIPVAEQFLISQMAALAIYDYFSFYTNEVKIKWPNDIYISDKKISGTLIENSIQGASISYSIVGIGININQVNFSNPRSTSLALITGSMASLEVEFSKLVHSLDAGYLRLKSKLQQDHIRLSYLRHLHGYQQTISFLLKNEIVKGTVTDITKSGRLCIKFEGKNEIQEFGLKEIEFLWDK
ncbi:biotin--[acetyl-CoA-carboxylase] ligase [Dyadobacter sp. NIV53]|uniref:biotin--[acetyl-CoA-carboxylase] ligase n=1 Tax=Dyadobacter sp. NIV53 TaxID=2861765 RepID=UPI001C88E0CA|nr:biotin--[acetyl-CoA-carboxylase] ligase [Dyadobacter sp. NIV53]